MFKNENSNIEGRANEEATKYEEIVNLIKTTIFDIHYNLLLNHSSTIVFEIITSIVEMLQLLSFTFHKRLEEIIQPKIFYTTLNPFFSYNQLIFFYKDNRDLFFISYYFFIIICLTTILLFAYLVVHKQSSENASYKICIALYRTIMSIITKIAFVPVLQSFLSIYICENNKNVIITDYDCWNSKHYLQIGIGAPFLLIFVIQSFFFISTFFDVGYNVNNSLNRKTNRNEVFFFFEKILYLLILDFIPSKSYKLSITLMLLISIYSCLKFFHEKPEHNLLIFKVKLAIKIIFFWSMLCYCLNLIIDKFYKFNSSITLFLVGLPFFILCVFGYDFEDVSLEDILKIEDDENFLAKIYALQKKIDNYSRRKNQLDIKGYVFNREENCIFPDCPLRHFIECMDKKEEAVFYLTLHIEYLFQFFLSKHPNNAKIRLAFFIFLVERMNKKHKALDNLVICSNTENKSFETEFVVYRFMKLYLQTGEFKQEDINNKINLIYQNCLKKFNDEIKSTTLLYIDFWTLLYQNHLSHQQSVSKLNTFGKSINSKVSEIKDLFEKLQKLRPYDLEPMKKYYDFLREILLASDKAKALKKKIKEVEESTYEQKDNFEVNGHFDLRIINRMDQEYFIIIDPLSQNIINISLGLCPMLGYSKKELLENSINLLLPQIFHYAHRLMLSNKFDKFKKEKDIRVAMNNSLYEKPITFAISKAKYLVPISLKCQLNQTELSDAFWVVRISNDFSFQRDEGTNTVCYIITDENFTIKEFTCNCLKHLELESNAVNGGNNIFSYIKEFEEEFLNTVISKGEKDEEEKLLIKIDIAQKVLNKQIIISWRKKDEELECSGVDYDEGIRFKQYLKKVEQFKMTLNSVCFNTVKGTKNDGYVFRFEKIQPSTPKKYATNSKLLSLQPPKKYGFLKMKTHFRNSFVGNPFQKFSLTNSATELSKNEFDIDGQFVPNASKDEYFLLDPIGLAFNQRKRIKTEDIRTTALIKEQALKKIKVDEENNRQSTGSFSSDSEEEEEESERDSSNEEISSSSDIQSENSKDSSSKKKVVNFSDINDKDSYYKVNLNKIKLSIYDYQSKLFKEKKFNKTSKVEEIKLGESGRKQSFVTQKSSKQEGDSDMLQIKEFQTEYELSEPQKRNFILCQINTSLHKQESQPTIIRLRIISFMVFAILLGNGVTFFLLSNSTLKGTKIQNMRLHHAFQIFLLNMVGANYVRELMTLNFEVCDNYHIPKASYEREIREILGKLYVNGTKSINYLVAHSNDLQQNNYREIFQSMVQIEILEDNYSTTKYNITLISALIKSFTSLFEIAQTDQPIPLNRDVFYFTANSLNSIFSAITNVTTIYRNEVPLYILRQRKKIFICYCAISAIIISSFFFIKRAFEKVMKKKESYFGVFYEISGKDILISLSKCELFAQNIQNENSLNVNDNNELSFSYEDLENKATFGRSQKNISLNQEEKQISKERCFTMIFTVIFFAFCIFYILVLYFSFNSFTKKIPNYLALYSQQNNILMVSYLANNNMKSFFFDSNIKSLSFPLKYMVGVMIEEAIKSENQIKNQIMTYQSYFGDEFTGLQEKIDKKDICDEIKWFFDSYYPDDPNNNCDTFLFGSARFGFDTFRTQYYDSLREIYGEYRYYQQSALTYDFKYNFTLYGTPGFDKLVPKNPQLLTMYNFYSPMKIICNDLMKKIQVTANYFIIPIYQKLVDSVKEKTDRDIEKQTNLHNITSALYILFISIFYIFFWNHHISKLNELIYKTKNMLSIIPSELLVDLKSVHKLLKIRSKNVTKI